MATIYGSQYTDAYVDNPTDKLNYGDFRGSMQVIYFNHTFVAAVNAISDILKLCKVPKGARVLGGRLYCPSTGTTGIFKWGWAADAAAVETADDDGFAVVADGDAGGQAVDITMKGSVPGMGKRFSAECDVQIAFTEATDAAAAVALKGYLVIAQY